MYVSYGISTVENSNGYVFLSYISPGTSSSRTAKKKNRSKTNLLLLIGLIVVSPHGCTYKFINSVVLMAWGIKIERKRKKKKQGYCLTKWEKNPGLLKNPKIIAWKPE